ncbi:MAG: hypothetical protein PHX61_02460 [Alphaproteobacteria bacterium]|nr:hypothetical protein [Alphaproteobacteria bacterium]
MTATLREFVAAIPFTACRLLCRDNGSAIAGLSTSAVYQPAVGSWLPICPFVHMFRRQKPRDQLCFLGCNRLESNQRTGLMKRLMQDLPLVYGSNPDFGSWLRSPQPPLLLPRLV